VVQYTPHGAVSVMKLGNSLWQHESYNSRQQPVQMGLGTSSTDSSTFALAYTFGVLNGSLDTTKNNGNVQSETITVGGHSIKQSFTYDRVSRLITAQEALDDNFTLDPDLWLRPGRQPDILNQFGNGCSRTADAKRAGGEFGDHPVDRPGWDLRPCWQPDHRSGHYQHLPI